MLQVQQTKYNHMPEKMAKINHAMVEASQNLVQIENEHQAQVSLLPFSISAQ